MILVVLGLRLSKSCCPLLEGMSDIWSHVKASVPESTTEPSTIGGLEHLGLKHVTWQMWSQEWVCKMQIGNKYGTVHLELRYRNFMTSSNGTAALFLLFLLLNVPKWQYLLFWGVEKSGGVSHLPSAMPRNCCRMIQKASYCLCMG